MLVGLSFITAAAIWTRFWVLTSIPIGFLFGFFLQKGDLCGSSAFSEVVMMKDRRKVVGLWMVIVTAMAGFAVLDLLGWIVLNPKPFIYLNVIVGGILFGVGMVLAGGCISGCLYKAGAGNLNSMAALAGIPLGAMLVECGPLNPLQEAIKQHVIKTSDGAVASLPNVLGIPYWVPAVVFGVLTLLAVFIFRKKTQASLSPNTKGLIERIMTRPWKPWQAGVAIGLLMIPAYLASAASGRNYPLGAKEGVVHLELLLIDRNLDHVWKADKSVSQGKATVRQSVAGPGATVSNDTGVQEGAGSSHMKRPGKKVVWWMVGLVISLVAGSFVSGRLSGQARLLPKPPDETVIAFIGGLLVGVGTAIGMGCVVGQILSGWALMSVGSFTFGIVTILTNWVTTYVYMMGGSLTRKL